MTVSDAEKARRMQRLKDGPFHGWYDRATERWVCECGARGIRSMQGAGIKLSLLLDHFHRMHDGRGTIIHGSGQCDEEFCPFHHPSQHRMVDWPKHIRYDRTLLVERICPHGIGHPDPDSLVWVNHRRRALGWDRDDGTHGCDGCCRGEVIK